MNVPLKPEEALPADFGDPRPKLDFIIGRINQLIQESRERGGSYYDNADGTFDKFRCVVTFEGNNPESKEADHAWIIWKYYHAYLMDAYRQAGWGVKAWGTGQHVILGQFYPVPQYCLFLPQENIADVLNEMQSKIDRP